MSTKTERFVGIRNGIAGTFGYARNAKGQIEQVYSQVQNQRTVSQEWTGVVYQSVRRAAEDSWRLNSAAVCEA